MSTALYFFDLDSKRHPLKTRSASPNVRLFVLLALSFLWVAAVVTGHYYLLKNKNAPGTVGSVPVSWPVAAVVPPESDQQTLLLFAHPKCPCTRATISELSRLMTHCQGKLKARVYFYRPATAPESWAHSGTWTSASRIPGVTVQSDPDGRLAEIFGAQTSGQVLLFNPEGRLLFNGGITASRGHEGDNAGRDAIESIIAGNKSVPIQTSVFGCSLLDPKKSSNRY